MDNAAALAKNMTEIAASTPMLTLIAGTRMREAERRS